MLRLSIQLWFVLELGELGGGYSRNMLCPWWNFLDTVALRGRKVGGTCSDSRMGVICVLCRA